MRCKAVLLFGQPLLKHSYQFHEALSERGRIITEVCQTTVILTCSKYLFPLGHLNYYLSLGKALKDGEYVLTLITVNSTGRFVDPVRMFVGMKEKEQVHRDNATP